MRFTISRPGICAVPHLLLTAYCLLLTGCGYTTRPGLVSYLQTVYVAPFVNKIDLTELTTDSRRFPLYRHGLETDLTKAVINRFQFTGLLRPMTSDRADCRVEGELLEFRRDALRFDANKQVEEWRLSVVVNVRFFDQRHGVMMWDRSGFTGDTTYVTVGSKAESESQALDRATTDLARRIVEQTVENW